MLYYDQIYTLILKITRSIVEFDLAGIVRGIKLRISKYSRIFKTKIPLYN